MIHGTADEGRRRKMYGKTGAKKSLEGHRPKERISLSEDGRKEL